MPTPWKSRNQGAPKQYEHSLTQEKNPVAQSFRHARSPGQACFAKKMECLNQGTQRFPPVPLETTACRIIHSSQAMLSPRFHCLRPTRRPVGFSFPNGCARHLGFSLFSKNLRPRDKPGSSNPLAIQDDCTSARFLFPFVRYPG